MTPNEGGRPTTGKSGNGPAAARRLGLLVFGALFLILFVAVAIAQGLGNPSIPSGDIALVEDAPGDSGNISKEDFDRAMVHTAAQSGAKSVPKEGSDKYDEVKEGAVNSLLDVAWLKGEAVEKGISVTEKEVQEEFKKLKDENFKTPAEYDKFLAETKFTEEDVLVRVELQMLSTQIQEKVTNEAPKPSDREVRNYYEAAKSTLFTQQPTADFRLVLNKDRTKAETAKDLLTKDDSAANWKKVAKQFSEETATKDNGGEQKGVTEGTLEEPLNDAVFEATEQQVEGLIETDRGYAVFMVENTTPGSVQEFGDVKDQISSQLEQQLQQETFGQFAANWTSKWRSRTFCASGYETERCSNFKTDPHPATAPPGCYEENPKEEPEACPAPVFQLIPALPGTVSPLEPRGTAMAQRPIPEGLDPEGAAGEATPLPLPAP